MFPRYPDPDDPQQFAKDEKGRILNQSCWVNCTPITDVHEALDLLAAESPAPERGEVHHVHQTQGTHPWSYEIKYHWYHEGSSGGDTSGIDYYQIDPKLVRKLRDQQLIEPREQKVMGGMRCFPDELVITDAGRRKLEEYDERMRAHCCSLLAPRMHPRHHGVLRYRGHERDGFRCGPLWYRYEMPDGQIYKVYPEEGRILSPEDQAKADAAV